MSVDYLPVMLSVAHPYPELEYWVTTRFEMLNGRRMKVIRRSDLPKEALRSHSQYSKAWLWDVVPDDVDRILYFDFDLVPLRPLPEIPDAPFVAVPDAQWYSEAQAARYLLLDDTAKYFNSGFFIAKRETRPAFEKLKALVERKHPNDTRPYDQTKLNLLIQSEYEVAWLPRSCNVIAPSADSEAGEAAINMHLCGLSQSSRWVLMNTLRTTLGMSLLP